MCIVSKIKKNEFSTLKDSLSKRLGSKPEFYSPKILIDSLIKNKLHRKKKYILENYVFLKHDKFLNKGTLNTIKYLKGIDFVLPFFNSSQNEIINFIKKCKDNENKLGYLSQSFFELVNNKNIEFSTGPFSKFVGALIEVQKNKIKVLVNNYLVSINSQKTIVF